MATTTDVRYEADGRPTEPKRSESSLGELFSELSSELSELFREEIALAKVEARDEAKRLGTAAGLFGGAGLAAWLTLVFASFAIAWALDLALDRALSFAIVGALWAIAALIMLSAARARMKTLRGLPETRRSMKEDLEWARQQKS